MCSKEHKNARKVLKRKKRQNARSDCGILGNNTMYSCRQIHFGGTCCLHLKEDYTWTTRRCVKIKPINLYVFEDQPANRNCSKVFSESIQFNEGIKFAPGKETSSNSPLPKWEYREKNSHSLPLTLDRNIHQKETLFRNAAKSEVMRKDKLHFSGRWHTIQSSAKSNQA